VNTAAGLALVLAGWAVLPFPLAVLVGRSMRARGLASEVVPVAAAGLASPI
jgi:hypothetical protein